MSACTGGCSTSCYSNCTGSCHTECTNTCGSSCTGGSTGDNPKTAVNTQTQTV